MPQVVELDGPVRVVLRKESPGLWVYEAWEPAGDRRYAETMEGQIGGTWGRVDSLLFVGKTSEDPDEYMAQWVEWERSRRDAAYRAILQAFPEGMDGYRSKGLIRMFGNPAPVRARLERKGEIEPAGSVGTAPTFAGS